MKLGAIVVCGLNGDIECFVPDTEDLEDAYLEADENTQLSEAAFVFELNEENKNRLKWLSEQ